MNLRELINHMIFRNRKYEIVKNNFAKQNFPDDQLQFTFEYIMYHRLSITKDFNFIQIGANDGIRSDPIHTFAKKNLLSGILLEPVKFYYNELVKNYSGYEHVILVNKAIHPSKTEGIIFRISDNSIGEDGIPLWAPGIATFEKKIMEKHIKDYPGLEKYLITEKVDCISWSNLLSTYKVEKIDLLLIDAEGFDYEVIKMIEFEKLQPAIIRFEHAHLNNKDLYECMDLLINNGYKLNYQSGDTTAYLS